MRMPASNPARDDGKMNRGKKVLASLYGSRPAAIMRL